MRTQADVRREIVAEESIEASLGLAPLDDMSAGEFLTKGLELEAVQYIIDVEGIPTSLLTVASGLALSMRCLTCTEMPPAHKLRGYKTRGHHCVTVSRDGIEYKMFTCLGYKQCVAVPPSMVNLMSKVSLLSACISCFHPPSLCPCIVLLDYLHLWTRNFGYGGHRLMMLLCHSGSRFVSSGTSSDKSWISLGASGATPDQMHSLMPIGSRH